MKHITAKRCNDEDWSMRFLDDKDYDTCYSEDVFVKREDGTPLMVLLKHVIPTELNAKAWSVLRKYHSKSSNRGTAAGIESTNRKRMDGSLSQTLVVPKGWEVDSSIVGFFERTARMPYGRACAWNEKHPKEFSMLFPLVDRVSELFKKTVPDKWNYQNEVVQRTPKDYIISNSVFTTLTINKNFRTSCHKDAGDLEVGFSCMSVIREGQFSGGRICLPNYRIAAELETGDLIMFDPHEFHGNTQIVGKSKNFQRCSIVYYYREKIQFCKSMKEELEFAKNKKFGSSLFE